MIDFKKQRLLVIAPHPDDEVIGCGGLIKKIKDAGGKVFVLFLTVGDTRDFTKAGLSTGRQRLKEIEAVARFLKYDNWDLAFLGDDYHLKLDTLGQKALMDVIERDSKVSIEKIKPTIVACSPATSYNQDHVIAARATHAALRAAPNANKHLVNLALFYESAADAWTIEKRANFNFFVPLSKNALDAKMKALSLYKSQTRKFPSTRSFETLKALATLRGSQAGHELAEAFVILRAINE